MESQEGMQRVLDVVLVLKADRRSTSVSLLDLQGEQVKPGAQCPYELYRVTAISSKLPISLRAGADDALNRDDEGDVEDSRTTCVQFWERSQGGPQQEHLCVLPLAATKLECIQRNPVRQVQPHEQCQLLHPTLLWAWELWQAPRYAKGLRRLRSHELCPRVCFGCMVGTLLDDVDEPLAVVWRDCVRRADAEADP